MPFLSEKVIQNRVDSPDNLKNKLQKVRNELPTSNLEIHELKRSRPGSINVPIEIKKVIGILGNEGVRQKDLAEAFGISGEMVSCYERGTAKTNDHHQSPALAKVINDVRARVNGKKEEVEDVAIDTLLKTLNLIPDKVHSDLPLKTLLSTGRQLSSIAATISGRDKDKSNGADNQVHVHIYAPKQKSVDDYEVIDI